MKYRLTISGRLKIRKCVFILGPFNLYVFTNISGYGFSKLYVCPTGHRNVHKWRKEERVRLRKFRHVCADLSVPGGSAAADAEGVQSAAVPGPVEVRVAGRQRGQLAEERATQLLDAPAGPSRCVSTPDYAPFACQKPSLSLNLRDVHIIIIFLFKCFTYILRTSCHLVCVFLGYIFFVLKASENKCIFLVKFDV